METPAAQDETAAQSDAQEDPAPPVPTEDAAHPEADAARREADGVVPEQTDADAGTRGTGS